MVSLPINVVRPESKISKEHFCGFISSLFGANRKYIYGFPRALINPGSQEAGRDEKEREMRGMRGREGRKIRGLRGGKDEESTDASCKGNLRHNSGNSEHFTLLGKSYPLKGLGSRLEPEEYMLRLVLPRACSSPHHTHV